MSTTNHHFSDLFSQLGLPSDTEGIQQFLRRHAPLAGDIQRPDASFWTSAQASFLRDALQQDADWAELVDQLNQALRGAPPV